MLVLPQKLLKEFTERLRYLSTTLKLVFDSLKSPIEKFAFFFMDIIASFTNSETGIRPMF